MPALSNVDLKIVLLDMYETHAGIYNQINNPYSTPLSSVGFHPSEDYNTGSLLEQSMSSYIRKGIKELFNISYIEYMELPHDVMELMHDVANKEISVKKSQIDQIEKEMGQ